MTRLIQLKSNCTLALERCIRNCHQLISVHKSTPGMEKCIQQAIECRDVCVECLAACESVQPDRGVLMYKSYTMCKASLTELQQHELVECRKCVNACLICIEEFEHILA